MKFLILTLLIASPSAWSALNMKPGLWKMNMRIVSEGKPVEVTGQSPNPAKNIPEAEKQKLMSLMGKSNAGVGPNGETNVCYSKEAIRQPEKVAKPEPKCETTLVTNTATKVVTNFKCPDGTTGDATWDVKAADTMMGMVNLRDPQGKTSQVSYNGKFQQDACGKVKPVL
jgi:hypothetical protein